MLDESEVFSFTDGLGINNLDTNSLDDLVLNPDGLGVPEFDRSEIDETIVDGAVQTRCADIGVEDQESLTEESEDATGSVLFNSEKLGLLFDGCCVLTFQYPDGSVVESVTTLNHDLLNMYGLNHIDGVVDIEERTPIPEQMFELLRGIRPGDKKHLSPLDKFFEIGGKLGW